MRLSLAMSSFSDSISRARESSSARCSSTMRFDVFGQILVGVTHARDCYGVVVLTQ